LGGKLSCSPVAPVGKMTVLLIGITGILSGNALRSDSDGSKLVSLCLGIGDGLALETVPGDASARWRPHDARRAHRDGSARCKPRGSLELRIEGAAQLPFEEAPESDRAAAGTVQAQPPSAPT
jgi:hypothetical protein